MKVALFWHLRAKTQGFKEFVMYFLCNVILMYFTFLLLHCCTVHFYYTCSNFMNVALCWPLRAKSLFS